MDDAPYVTVAANERVAAALTVMIPLLLPPSDNVSVPELMFTTPLPRLLNAMVAALENSCTVPAPDLVHVPSLLNALVPLWPDMELTLMLKTAPGLLLNVPLVNWTCPLDQFAMPKLFSVRPSPLALVLEIVSVTLAGMTVVPLPDIVPLAQFAELVMVMSAEPASVPPEIVKSAMDEGPPLALRVPPEIDIEASEMASLMVTAAAPLTMMAPVRSNVP